MKFFHAILALLFTFAIAVPSANAFEWEKDYDLVGTYNRPEDLCMLDANVDNRGSTDEWHILQIYRQARLGGRKYEILKYPSKDGASQQKLHTELSIALIMAAEAHMELKILKEKKSGKAAYALNDVIYPLEKLVKIAPLRATAIFYQTANILMRVKSQDKKPLYKQYSVFGYELKCDDGHENMKLLLVELSAGTFTDADMASDHFAELPALKDYDKHITDLHIKIGDRASSWYLGFDVQNQITLSATPAP